MHPPGKSPGRNRGLAPPYILVTIMTTTCTTAASLCDADNSVLLIIDIQTQLTAAMPAKVLARLQRNTTMLINTARTLDIPIFATARDKELLGEAEVEIRKLLPDTAKQYHKTCFSCADADRFADDLAATNRKQAILVGMEAHVCILQTALDLNRRGYTVFVIADAVCSRHRENYETALRRMSKAGAVVCDAESALFEWARNLDLDLSRQVQALLR